MDNCETNLLLKYANQSVTIKNTGWASRPLNDKDIEWINDQFVTISYSTGGNCYNCEGIDIGTLDTGTLQYLGKFSAIKDGYIVKNYDTLEDNEITNHAQSPSWVLYYKSLGGKAVLDIEMTCTKARDRYSQEKNELMDETPTYNFTPYLLSTLALSRFCGWQNEYVGIIKATRSKGPMASPMFREKMNQELTKVKPAI